MEQLKQGKSFITHIDTNAIYPQIQGEPSSIRFDGYFSVSSLPRL